MGPFCSIVYNCLIKTKENPAQKRLFKNVVCLVAALAYLARDGKRGRAGDHFFNLFIEFGQESSLGVRIVLLAARRYDDYNYNYNYRARSLRKSLFVSLFVRLFAKRHLRGDTYEETLTKRHFWKL